MIKSVFLAGPTPRSIEVISWRKEAIEHFKNFGFDGTLFIPEPRDGIWREGYSDQVDWEDTALNIADCIMFWIPRELKNMPAFTTNDEWGRWKESGKVVFGVPAEAQNVKYQKYYADMLSVPEADTLEETVKLSIKMAGEGAERRGGERHVPFFIWKTKQFQDWHTAQKKCRKHS
jgi:hypothetical protein